MGYLQRANGLRIDALTSDYLNVSSSTYLWSDSIEAPAILKKNGYYFMFGSHLTGWSPNDNVSVLIALISSKQSLLLLVFSRSSATLSHHTGQVFVNVSVSTKVYCYATSLSGPWSSWATFASTGSNTYTSQTNYVLPLGSSGIYMGDRWVSSNLMRSTYVWLPLTISGTTVTMANYVNWTPNVSAGTWAAGPSETQPEAETATLASGATKVSCSGCSGSTAVGYIGGSSGGSVTFSGVSSSASTKTTIRIKYENGNTGQRFAKVTVNGVAQTIAFLPSEDGNSPASSVVHAQLTSGSSNTVVIAGVGDGTYGPDIDRIMVPTS